MTSHYHQIWETLVVANQQLKQWLHKNQPLPNNTTTTTTQDTPHQTSQNSSQVELEMEIVKELEQSMSEIGSVDSLLGKELDTSRLDDLSQQRQQLLEDAVECEDDYVLLHRDTHRHVCKTMDYILDQDAKYLSKMKENWQQLLVDCVKPRWQRHVDKKQPQNVVKKECNDTSDKQYEQGQKNIHQPSYTTATRNNHQGHGHDSYTRGKVRIEVTPFYRRLVFPNGSCKEIYSNGRMETYYAPSQIHKIDFSNGTRLILFPNGQLERHLSDGRVEVVYPDGSIGLVSKDGKSERLFLGNGRVLYKG
ncbi:hypothetical protein GAYE_SCF17G3810 [Galdieria yellowstonensis]|uniref:Centromere protein J C-terminal domain-containing protein n=1 Tax=Galdieria yellowstonensis TaxID=3028027 RepID=A0AAV9IF71_9RHOD|nr:hypothetical protein GAYE_SCF17G3810 [Galdieria yellowstonensis]